LDHGRHYADQDHDRDRQQDVGELAAPCADLDELCLDLHCTHLKSITPNSERQRVRTALPSLSECTSHRPRLSGPSQISSTWCGQNDDAGDRSARRDALARPFACAQLSAFAARSVTRSTTRETAPQQKGPRRSPRPFLFRMNSVRFLQRNVMSSAIS